jgi:hypothetical protein
MKMDEKQPPTTRRRQARDTLEVFMGTMVLNKDSITNLTDFVQLPLKES